MGSTEVKTADVKIVASAQPDLLHQKLIDGSFRKDLYYRLAGKIISVPALKDIIGDLPVIIDDLVYRLESDTVKRNEVIRYFKSKSREMEEYHWPGNVRELANYVKRRLRLGDEEEIVLGDCEIGNYVSSNVTADRVPGVHKVVSVTFGDIPKDISANDIKSGAVLFESVEDVKVQYMNHVLKLLQEKGLSQDAIAKVLDVSKNTLMGRSRKK
jgi:transcriptional regulator with PAS, ATPase and Fis domain